MTEILAVFTSVLEWFVTALSTVAGIFHDGEKLTFIGSITVIGFAIAVILLVIGMIRGLLKGRG